MWIQQSGNAGKLELSGNDGCEMWIKRHICELVGFYSLPMKLPPVTVLSSRNKVSLQERPLHMLRVLSAIVHQSNRVPLYPCPHNTRVSSRTLKIPALQNTVIYFLSFEPGWKEGGCLLLESSCSPSGISVDLCQSGGRVTIRTAQVC